MKKRRICCRKGRRRKVEGDAEEKRYNDLLTDGLRLKE
jgi:hypothetical protein